MSRFSFSCISPCVLLVTIGILVAGCNKKVAKTETPDVPVSPAMADLIAVIDLNVVAQEIGAQAKIDIALKDRESELTSKYNGLRAELDRRVAAVKGTATDLNDEQQNQINQLINENHGKLTLQAQAAQTQLSAHHAQLKQKLLNEIRPVAYGVAQDKGMKIVLTVGQVYAAGPNVDITQDVIKKIQSINEANASLNPSEETPVRVADLPGGGDFMPR